MLSYLILSFLNDDITLYIVQNM